MKLTDAGLGQCRTAEELREFQERCDKAVANIDEMLGIIHQVLAPPSTLIIKETNHGRNH